MASTTRSDDGDHVIDGTRSLDAENLKECAPQTVMSPFSPDSRPTVLGGGSVGNDNRRRSSIGMAGIVHSISSARDGSLESSATNRSSYASNRTSTPVTNRKLLSEALRGASQGASLDSDVMKLVTLTGCEELLRVSHLVTVLQRQGRIFGSSAGSASTYQMSQQTDAIDTFISHNWSVPRYKKYLALAFHFNYGVSAVVGSAVAVGLGVGNCLGVLPAVIDDRHQFPRGIMSRLVVIPVWVGTVLFLHDFQKLIGIKGPRVFLDKTCIHQTDAEIQRRGIERLGAFLFRSKTILVLYTDVYLLKLWTVYEVAAFLSLHPTNRMKILPTFIPMLFFSCALIVYISRVTSMFVDLSTGFSYSVTIVMIITGMVLLYIIRQWTRAKVNLRSRLEDFSVSESSCFDENDRPIVYRNIAVLMRQIEAVPNDCSEAVALEAFNQLVRTELPNAIAGSVGRQVLKYRYLLGLSLAMDIPELLDGLSNAMPVRYIVRDFLWFVPMAVAFWPMIAVWMQVWSSRCLHLRGCVEFLYLLSLWIFVIVPPFLLAWGVLLTLWTMSSESDIGMAALACTNLVFFLGAWLTFRTRASTSSKLRPRSGESDGRAGEAEAEIPPSGNEAPESSAGDVETSETVCSV